MSWSSVKLGELVDIRHGFPFKSEYFTDQGTHILLTPGNCHENGGLKLKGEKEKYYAGEIPKDYLLSSGDLLVVMTDLVNTAPILGGSFLIPEDDRFLHNQRLGLISLKDSSRIHKRFLYYLLNTRNYRGQVRGSASGATVRHTSPDRIKACVVRIPETTREQSRIADILSAYDDLIENNRRRIELLEQAARLLYKEWFVHLRFPGHEHVKITGGVPEGWNHGVVADFYQTASGGTPSRKTPEYFTGEVPWVKTQELPNGFILDTEEHITDDAVTNSAAKLFAKSTVLLALYGATIGELGILSTDATCNQACCAIMPKDRRSHYVHAYLFFRENKRNLVSLSGGAAQNNISQQIVRAFPMTMPAATLIGMFVEVVQPLFDQWINLERQNQALKAARDLLLPRLMNGEIAV